MKIKPFQMSRKTQNTILAVFLAVSFISLFAAINTGAYRTDDFDYMQCWMSDVPLSSISDIVYYQIQHYLHWGGRTVAHTILQIGFLIGKPWSSLATALTYFVIAYLIVYIAADKRNSVFFALALAAMYYLNPAFEDTVLWNTGSANYLWTSMIILIAILPFVRFLKGKSIQWFDYICVPFSFLAGWCNENISTTMLLVMFYILFINRKRIRQNRHLLIAFILAAAGCAFLILAPGNYARAGVFPSGLLAIAYKGHGQVNAWFNWLFPAIILAIILLYLQKKKSIEIDITQKVFAAWAVLSILVMIASPSYPDRATFGTLVILLVPIIKSIDTFYQNDSKLIVLLAIMSIIAFACCMTSIGLLQFVRNIGVVIPG